MLFEQQYLPDLTTTAPTRQLIRDFYRADENKVLGIIIPMAETSAKIRTKTWERARKLIVEIRRQQVGKGGVDALLQEFSLSSEEGVVLMCLAEALLRVPDKLTADALIRDKLSGGDWVSHIGQSDSIFVNASSWGLLLTGKLVNYRKEESKNQYGILKQMVGRLGEPIIRKAVRQSMELMGSQFVMGVNIHKALKRALPMESKGYSYSYDMLGEGARTMMDADRYFDSYLNAIEEMGLSAQGRGPIKSPGISIKLSALHPRYEFSQKQRVMDELLPRLKTLAMAAKNHDIGFTIDAEEADRLDLSLDVIQALFNDADLGDWSGFGMAVQAYQKRAVYVIDWIRELTQVAGRKMMVRLVKGAYWDSEIKISQTEGFDDFPVFTRKASSDVCYQACAKKLLDYRDSLFPQFASHNAYTVSTILEMSAATEEYQLAGNVHRGFEFQRLHGMGKSLFDQVLKSENVTCRVYAPVGAHVDLLAYLVRRLLENGANSSFVSNLVDENISVESLLPDPLETVISWKEKRNFQIAKPKQLYFDKHLGKQRFINKQKNKVRQRVNSVGLDLTDANRLLTLKSGLERWVNARLLNRSNNEKEGLSSTLSNQAFSPPKLLVVTNPANTAEVLCYLDKDDDKSMLNKLSSSYLAWKTWSKTPISNRAEILLKTADALERNMDEFMAICIKEAGKTAKDSIAEVREAVDFCRYYAINGEKTVAGAGQHSLGVVLCISPWNFPLAIFLGQVSAALICGNTVIAKPAEQTSLVAHHAIALMLKCGLPKDVVSMTQARGSQVGNIIIPDERIKAVMFTGSTEVGNWIAKTLAARGCDPIPLIAETGGQNCMIVDSTALPEQVVDDVIASGFQSAGQRCSALRVLFLQEEIADKVTEMVCGAMQELQVGDPKYLSTDVGPVIDHKALASLQEHAQQMESKAKLLYQCKLSQEDENKGTFFAPRLYQIENLSVLKHEVFGPCVHIIRFKADQLDEVMNQIEATGFGLTMGIHSRIESKCAYLAERSPAGNVYVNRNMIGAVVGVQPFGGRRLSGTGPKAGGPHYLKRLVKSNNASVGKILTAQDFKSKSKQAGNGSNSASLRVLQDGLSEWRFVPLSNRVSVMRQLLAHLSDDEEFNLTYEILDRTITKIRAQLLKIETVLALPTKLAGPTGESNCLSLEPRGVIAILFDHQSSLDTWMLGVITALAAGNTLLVIIENNKYLLLVQRFAKAIAGIGVGEKLLQINPIDCLNSVLSAPALAGVVVEPQSDWQSYVSLTIAKRQGEILPVMSEVDGDALYYRLVTEKTVSIDTTAAGGNASLMTMPEEGS